MADDTKSDPRVLLTEDALRKRALSAAHEGIDRLSEALAAGLLSAAVAGVRPAAEFVRSQGADLQSLLAGLLGEDGQTQGDNDNDE